MAHKLSFRTILLVATALSATAAHAQDPNERVTILERIIVGAGNEKVAIETPQSVTVLNQEDIDQAQPTTIGDIARDIPGLNVSGSDRVLGQSFNIRGIGAPEASGDQGRLIVNIDGVTKFYEQYRIGSFFSEPELFSKVEVLRGPAFSTLYGPGAIGGIINFETKDASDFLQEGDKGYFRTKSTYTSNDEGLLGSFVFAHEIDERTDFLLTSNYRTTKNYSTGDGLEILGSEFDTWSGLAKVTHDTDDGELLKVSYQRWETLGDDQAYDRTQSVGNVDFGTVDRNVVDQTAIISYENDFIDNDWLDLEIMAAYSDSATTLRDASGFAPNAFFPGSPPGGCGFGPTDSVLFCDSNYGYQSYQFRAQNTIRSAGEDWENFLILGYQFIDQTRTGEDITGTFPNIGFHPEGSDVAHGFYVQSEFTWNERLTIIPGIRYDTRTLTDTDNVTGFGSADDTAISPKIAAHLQVNDNFAIFGSVAHTERFPTIDETFSTTTNGAVFQASIGLEKEEADSWEVGFSYSAENIFEEADSFQIKTTYFNSTVEGLIVRNPAAPAAFGGPPNVFPFTPGFINLDNAEFQGVEIEAAYDAERWFANAAYTWTEGVDANTGDFLTTVAPEELAFTIGARIPENDVEFGWKSRFVADPADACRVSTTPVAGCAGGSSLRFAEGFNVHDVFFTWTPDDGAYEGLEVRLGVDNVFDTDYKEFLNNDPAKGRNFKVTLAKAIGW